MANSQALKPSTVKISVQRLLMHVDHITSLGKDLSFRSRIFPSACTGELYLRSPYRVNFILPSPWVWCTKPNWVSMGILEQEQVQACKYRGFRLLVKLHKQNVNTNRLWWTVLYLIKWLLLKWTLDLYSLTSSQITICLASFLKWWGEPQIMEEANFLRITTGTV